MGKNTNLNEHNVKTNCWYD